MINVPGVSASPTIAYPLARPLRTVLKKNSPEKHESRSQWSLNIFDNNRQKPRLSYGNFLCNIFGGALLVSMYPALAIYPSTPHTHLPTIIKFTVVIIVITAHSTRKFSKCFNKSPLDWWMRYHRSIVLRKSLSCLLLVSPHHPSSIDDRTTDEESLIFWQTSTHHRYNAKNGLHLGRFDLLWPWVGN